NIRAALRWAANSTNRSSRTKRCSTRHQRRSLAAAGERVAAAHERTTATKAPGEKGAQPGCNWATPYPSATTVLPCRRPRRSSAEGTWYGEHNGNFSVREFAIRPGSSAAVAPFDVPFRGPGHLMQAACHPRHGTDLAAGVRIDVGAAIVLF